MIEFIALVYIFVGAGLGIVGWKESKKDPNVPDCSSYVQWWAVFIVFIIFWPGVITYVTVENLWSK